MKNTVTEKQIQDILSQTDITVSTVYDKVTVVSAKFPNGFVITESSGAVDKANYDKEIGTKICMEHIKNKLWELEGYRLASKLSDKIPEKIVVNINGHRGGDYKAAARQIERTLKQIFDDETDSPY